MAPNADKIYGIRELYRPKDAEPELDIVAVHGLNGDAHRTWTNKDNGICWLNDPDFLPKYVPKARVLVWGYNASFSSMTGEQPSKDRIHNHAHTLVANLGTDRRIARMADKPIIFLCHSLGGIIVKRALCYAQTRTGHKVALDYNIFSCTYGILFFGTPHHGSSKATWLATLKKIGSLVTPSPLGIARSDLLAALEHESETLQNITDFFSPLMRRFRIYYFWEQEQTDLRPLPGGRDYIVPCESAAPPHDEAERAGIAAAHADLVRFGDPQAQGFRMVVDALMRYSDDASAVIAQRRAAANEAMARERWRETQETINPHQWGWQQQQQQQYSSRASTLPLRPLQRLQSELDETWKSSQSMEQEAPGGTSTAQMS